MKIFIKVPKCKLAMLPKIWNTIKSSIRLLNSCKAVKKNNQK